MAMVCMIARVVSHSSLSKTSPAHYQIALLLLLIHQHHLPVKLPHVHRFLGMRPQMG